MALNDKFSQIEQGLLRLRIYERLDASASSTRLIEGDSEMMR